MRRLPLLALRALARQETAVFTFDRRAAGEYDPLSSERENPAPASLCGYENRRTLPTVLIAPSSDNVAAHGAGKQEWTNGRAQPDGTGVSG